MAPQPQDLLSLVVPILPVDATSVNFDYQGFNMVVGNRQPVIRTDTSMPCGSHVQWVHSLMMSPQTIKQLAQVMQATIEEYERKFGAIPVLAAMVGDGATGETIQPETETCRSCRGGGTFWSPLHNALEPCIDCLGTGKRPTAQVTSLFSRPPPPPT